MTKDYYTFGAIMPGRQYSSSAGYRYGMNGQENDNEVYGTGNLTSAEYWEYDTRLGRRWNRDPVLKPWESPYACFSNNPIYYKDPRGLTAEGTGDKEKNAPKGDNVNTKDFPLNKGGEGIGMPEFSISAKKTSFLSKVGNWFSKVGNSIANFLGKADAAVSNKGPVETNFSGMQPTSYNSDKNIAFKSKAEGIENTSPVYPGAIIMGKGGGAGPKGGVFAEAVDVFKEANYGFRAGSDAVEGATEPVLQIVDDIKLETESKKVAESATIYYTDKKDGSYKLMKTTTSKVDEKTDSLINKGQKVTGWNLPY